MSRRLPDSIEWSHVPPKVVARQAAAYEHVSSWDTDRDPLYHWKKNNPNPERAMRHALEDRTWAAVLLTTLFGPRVTPTARGLSVARVALALGAVAFVVVVALLLTAVAGLLVDPTP